MLCHVWDNTEQSLCSKLVESMPRRLQAVIDAKGGPTSIDNQLLSECIPIIFGP